MNHHYVTVHTYNSLGTSFPISRHCTVCCATYVELLCTSASITSFLAPLHDARCHKLNIHSSGFRMSVVYDLTYVNNYTVYSSACFTHINTPTIRTCVSVIVVHVHGQHSGSNDSNDSILQWIKHIFIFYN